MAGLPSKQNQIRDYLIGEIKFFCFHHSISIFRFLFVFNVIMVISGLQLILILNEFVPRPLLVY